MDNETSTMTPTPVTTGSAMPKSTPFAPVIAGGDPTGRAVPVLEPAAAVGERNAIFQTLVKNDGDIAGLVAYSIYKQNKLDWLTAFEALKRRAPDDAELASYIIGEGTPRRLAIYRHLAEATLIGRGPDITGRPEPGRAPVQRRPGLMGHSALSGGLIVTYALIALLFILGFWLAAHFTMGSR